MGEQKKGEQNRVEGETGIKKGEEKGEEKKRAMERRGEAICDAGLEPVTAQGTGHNVWGCHQGHQWAGLLQCSLGQR